MRLGRHAPEKPRTLQHSVALRALGAAGLGAASAGLWLLPVPAAPAGTPGTEAWRWLLSGMAAAGAMVLVWSAGRQAVLPWRALGRLLAEREGDDDKPLPAQGALEVRQSHETLNRWIGRRREATQRQRRLLGDASHQLRTPLAVLRTLLQGSPPDELGARREELLRTVDRATGVVNEMLARLKLDQRRAEPATSIPFRLDQAASEAALEFAPLIAARRLKFGLDAVSIEVRADAWMLGELVRNLLANAIRHTPPDAALGIVVRTAHDGPELIVWDSGPGLGDGPRERLFEPFAAASGSGIGLGLSICRELAQAIGARVELYNRTDGHQVIGVDAVVRWPTVAAPSTLSATHPHEGDPR
jgi:two-component system sensor histidine kinase TctE